VELTSRKIMPIAIAKEVAEAAKEYAVEQGHANLIVVFVDPGGHLLYLERGDGVAWGTVDVAVLKAQTAVRFPGPSKRLETNLVDEGMLGLIGLPGVACFEGAVPILTDDGQVLGAISISGLTKELDGEIAQAGADALPRILARR
jgi:uncharacterized protein GlcG (DUF336 family)